MTVKWGDTGRVVYGTQKTFTVTLAAPKETLLGTPVALPTTEPGTSQISITIQSTDVPTISPTPLSVKYAALLYSGGKNTDTATQSVSWRILKNGSSVATGTQTGIATNTFWTQCYFQLFDVSVGDVVEIRLWATSANANYDYYALSIVPTRINVGKSYINKDANYNVNSPQLTLGTPAINYTSNLLVYPNDSATDTVNIGSQKNFGAIRWNPIYFTGRVDRGDATIATSTLTHATYRPYYLRPNYLSSVSFCEILR